MEGAEAAKRSGLPSGTLWRDHLCGETWITHGDVGGTTDFSWSFDKTFKRWKMNHQTPPLMMLAAPFAGMRGTKGVGSCDVLPDHTADSAKDVILNNASSLNTLAEDRYKQNLRE